MRMKDSRVNVTSITHCLTGQLVVVVAVVRRRAWSVVLGWVWLPQMWAGHPTWWKAVLSWPLGAGSGWSGGLRREQ